ncbi:uncharacterized protein LOC143631409 [Bidens hawaiensis]|uniref:uncharacterized protein LOC143631409 n=1 Tax=Bidens hawaiensis TaxID=980011 RepID=UPI00404B1E62
MDRLQHVIEEAKLRTVWWMICIFIVTYFLTHTSKSMWMNIPIAIAIISGLHIFVTEVEFHWKTRKPNQQSYLSHLERKQLSVNDSRLSTLPTQSKWKRKIDSPVVEAAMEDFVNKILQDFVLDLWYANITPDKEAPQLIHAIIMDIFAEISIRVKDINLVDLLTRDLVDLVGDHLELFRKNQAAIGIEVMVTLSSEERDERLKHHLMASNELHPALISSESEYKFLKRIMGAVLAAVLRTREAQCPLVRCIVRELLTCLVMQPVMRFASPGFINELIAGLLLANDKKRSEAGDDDPSTSVTGQNQNHETSQDLDDMKRDSSTSQKNNTYNDQNGTGLNINLNLNPPGLIISGPGQDGPLNPRSFAWARGLEAKTQRRTEVLQPENLENMWTKGRNYKKKSQKRKDHDLLSIANIAEQHEVWDFLSMTSKSYCFGRSSSVVRKLAVNVDEAVDDMVRQIKGVSGGLKKKAVGSGFESSASFANRNVSFKADELTDSGTKLTTSNSFSHNKGGGPAANIPSTSGLKEDPFGVPAEWTPTNVSVPLLNLVDNIFQLNRRGWLRRQVFWISKQILQLMMEDAIDDCLLRQIRFLRRDTLVAQGIHWVQNILWPGGIFFLKLRQSQTESSQSNESSCKAPSAAGKNNKGSFEEQLEAARRANDIKNMILDGAPTTLVSLIGQKQYKQSAIDIYYFSQSAVCLKQLGYGLLELVVITVFPELRDIISDAHEKKNDPTV